MSNGMIVVLKDAQWLKRQKIAGRAVSSCLKEFAKMIFNKEISNALEIMPACNLILESFDCTPTFFNYTPDPSQAGFPAHACVSINDAVVHGIPTDYNFKEGDLVTLDIGATYQGAIADAAFTAPYGSFPDKNVADMVIACQNALNAGVGQVSVDNRLGAIGAAIHNSVKKTPFGLITDFGGHGIDYDKPHAAPFVENKSRANEGIQMEAGLSIAIEPMLTISKNINTKLLKDKWTIITKGLSSHFEHSVTLDPEGNRHIITEHLMDAKDFL